MIVFAYMSIWGAFLSNDRRDMFYGQKPHNTDKIMTMKNNKYANRVGDIMVSWLGIRLVG